eukprot:Opistho-1_new@19425
MLLSSSDWQHALRNLPGAEYMAVLGEGERAFSQRWDALLLGGAALRATWPPLVVRAQAEVAFEDEVQTRLLETAAAEDAREADVAAAHRRMQARASRVWRRAMDAVVDRNGVWGSAGPEYLKLDGTEDAHRRRLRVVRDPLGSSHKEASGAEAAAAPPGAITVGAGGQRRRRGQASSDAAWLRAAKQWVGIKPLAGAGALAAATGEEDADVAASAAPGGVVASVVAGVATVAAPVIGALVKKYILSLRADAITPGLQARGQVRVTSKAFYFTVDADDPQFGSDTNKFRGYI